MPLKTFCKCWIVWVTIMASGVIGFGLRPAHADPGLDAEAARVADADALVQRGIELRRVGNDLEALSVFEQAAARAPGSPRVRVHLAATHQALGQWLEAEQLLSDVLRETDDPYIRKHRATLEEAYAFVSQRLGSLDVFGDPAGAEVLLSGRPLGKLPLPGPARVPVGTYVLEVRMDGYYTISRPVAITSRAISREAVALGARASARPPVLSMLAPAPVEHDSGAPSSRWLTWTLAGLGAGAAVVGGVAWANREQHAQRWNSDACLAPDRRRGQICAEELSLGRTAEQVAYAGSITAGLLLGGALATWLLEDPRADEDHESAGVTRCDVGLANARCFGSF
jgi:hypothetical protein